MSHVSTSDVTHQCVEGREGTTDICGACRCLPITCLCGACRCLPIRCLPITCLPTRCAAQWSFPSLMPPLSCNRRRLSLHPLSLFLVVCLCIRSLSSSFSQRHTVQGIAGAMREGGGGGGGEEPSRRSAIVKSHIIKHKVPLLPLLQLFRLSVYFHQCVWVGGGGEMVGKEGSEREERGRSGSRHVSGR